MKKLIIFLFALVSVAYGQYAPSTTKTQFKNGVAIGSKWINTFGANDSNVVVIDPSGLMWYRAGIIWKQLTVSGDLSSYTTVSRFLDSLTDVQGRIQTKQPLGNYLTKSDSLSGGYTTWDLTKKKVDSLGALISTGGVSSFNSRTGAVVPLVGDYNTFYKGIADSFFVTGFTTRGRTKQVIDSLGELKVNYTDTASMLSNYRRTTTKITNSDLTNSTISGVSLGGNLFSHTNGFGLLGSAYNGSAAQTWNVDTTSGGLTTWLRTKKVIDSLAASTVSGVSSFNSRTGAVTPQLGDYSSFYKGVADSFFVTGFTTRGRTKQLTDSLGALKLNISDTSSMLTPFVRTYGAQTVGGIKTFSNYVAVTAASATTTATGLHLFDRRILSVASGGSSRELGIDAQYIAFNTGNTYSEKARLDSFGSLLIGGTTSNAGAYKLDVTGSARVSSLPSYTSGGTYVVSNGGILSSRTASEVRADIGAGTGSGTVTSVATNTGSGITGGTITTTGTIAADTTILSTKANVTALLLGKTDKSSISGTSGTLPIFGSSNSLSNSTITDNGSTVTVGSRALAVGTIASIGSGTNVLTSNGGTINTATSLVLTNNAATTNQIVLSNNSASANAYNQFALTTGTVTGYFGLSGAGNTGETGMYAPNNVYFNSGGTGSGFNIGNVDASGVVRFYTGGSASGNERGRILSSGRFLWGTTTDNGSEIFQANGGISATYINVASGRLLWNTSINSLQVNRWQGNNIGGLAASFDGGSTQVWNGNEFAVMGGTRGNAGDTSVLIMSSNRKTSSTGGYVEMQGYYAGGTNTAPIVMQRQGGSVRVGTTSSILGANESFAAYNNNTSFAVSAQSTTATVAPIGVYNSPTSGDNQFIAFYEGAYNLRGSIDFNRGSTLTRYNTTSDARLKKNIRNTSVNALEKIMQIKVRDYEWKKDGNTSTSMVAQELYKIFPEAVKKGDEGKEVKDQWQVSNSTLVPYLIKAIQEQQKEIESLKKQINGKRTVRKN